MAVAMLVLVFVADIVISAAQFRELEESAESSRLAAIASRAQAQAVDRLASIRAFVISGDSVNLQVELRYRSELPLMLDTLHQSPTAGDTVHAHIARIEEQLQAWNRDFAEPMLAMPRDAALRMGAEQLAGKAEFDPVRLAFARLTEALDQRIRAAERRLYLLQLLQLLLPAFLLLMVVVVLLRFRALILAKAGALEEQQERLEEQAVELEQQQAELESSNEDLAQSAIQAEEARDQAEDALAKLDAQTALLSSALESSPLGFSFHSADLRFTSVNKETSRILGIPAQELEGKNVSGTLPPGSVIREELLRTVLQTREAVLGVLTEVESSDDAVDARHYSSSYFPITSSKGELKGVGVVISDLSDQRRLEDELRQSQKMEAIGQLAGGVAHDFNNLLTVIVGHSEMLLSELRDTVALDDAKQIQRAASQAAALTHKLLAFSRKQVLVPKVIDLNNVVADVAPMLRRLIREDIEMDVRTSDDLRPVKVDPTQVEQVLLNLSVNARDAMPHGGRLTIRTANAELDELSLKGHPVGAAPGLYAVLMVSDNGTGMDESVRKRAFEPFFTTKETGKGTGLGLATVYGIVKQSGGHVWLYSEQGLGTTFKIFFPVYHGTSPAPSRETPSAARALASETILLVEDDPAVLALAKRVLEGLNYRVLTATNGHEALLEYATHRAGINLVLTDVVMPGMGGAELIRELWQIDPALPVVYMSGYTGDDVLEHGMMTSEAQFVQKPFTTQALAAAVRGALVRTV